MPLMPDGLAVFREFHACDAYGAFAIESCNRSFKRACKRVGLDVRRISNNRLRHSFLSEVYRETRDIATVARLGLHAEAFSPITARYTKAAHVDVDRAAVDALGARFAARRAAEVKPLRAVRQRGGKLHAKVARARN